MLNILVVDDDKMTLTLITEILEGAGYRVVATPHPHDAVEILNREVIDALVTDANMPGGISGFDLVKTIRKNPKFKDLPIAFLTGRREKKDIALGLECGANDYIIKPIDPHILKAKVGGLFKNRPADISKTSFSEATVRHPASWRITLEITTLSERGIAFTAPIAIPQGARIKIDTTFFEIVGIDSPLLRVDGHTAILSQNIFLIKTTFIGLTDTGLQKIRSFINVNSTKKKD